MATITGAATDIATANLRLTPETYTTVGTLVKTNKDFVLPDLVQSYGDQGITGFLNLVGAVKAGGTSDQVDWWESGRRHRLLNGSTGSQSGDQTTFTPSDTTDAEGAPVGPNDVVMDTNDGRRYIVIDVTGAPTAASSMVFASLDGDTAGADNSTDRDFVVLGNLYGQGTEQPTHFQDADVIKRENPLMDRDWETP